MRGTLLYLRHSRVPVAIASAGLAGVLISFVGALIVHPLPGSDLALPMRQIIPALPAIIIGVSASLDGPGTERTAVRRVYLLRGSLLVGEVCLTVLFMWVAIRASGQDPESAVCVRNALGLTGLSLLAGTAFGPTAAWLVPMLEILLPPVLYHQPEDDSYGLVSFFMQPAYSGNALDLAILLAFLGVAVSSRVRRYAR